jgi:hypothetical protein
MQKANAYGRNDEPDEIPSDKGAAQQLEQILASGLPSLYRRAYHILDPPAPVPRAGTDLYLADPSTLHK